MSTKADYTKEEWDLLVRSPVMAAMAVIAASPSGPIGVLKEMFAVGKGLWAGAEGTTNPLIGEAEKTAMAEVAQALGVKV